ncbi:MAG: hypothetical protein Q4B26_02305 [Eubacteriales bacterium]|nr:hypothetical protein [Eubacteriales bacterium]
MKRKIAIGVILAAVILGAGTWFTCFRPIGLAVTLSDEVVRQGELIDETHVTVKKKALLRTLSEISDYTFRQEQTETTYDVYVTADGLSGELHGDLMTGTLSSSYNVSVKEGDYFDSTKLSCTFSYADGTQKVPSYVETDAPDIFTEDTTIQVTTEYGVTSVPIYVAAVNGLTPSYEQDPVYQGSAFDQSKIHCDVSFADGSLIEDTALVVLDAPSYINEETTITISTGYGETSYTLTPIKATGIRFEGKSQYYDGDIFAPSSVVITYSDEESVNVSSEEIEWDEALQEPLTEGTEEIHFTWHDKEYRTTLTVQAGTSATEAEQKNEEEQSAAIRKLTDSNTYITVSQVENALLTHIILTNPQSQIKGDFAGGIGYGFAEPMSQASERTSWKLGVNGSEDGITPTVIIRHGELQQTGTTNGSEICLTIDGMLFTPDAGASGEDLQAMGVQEIWWSQSPLLMQTGYNPENLGEEKHTGTILAMVKSGEYYILSLQEDGMTDSEVINLLTNLNISYARQIGAPDETALYFGVEDLLGTDPNVSDMLYIAADAG